jgi:hypothetical protein
VQCAQFIVLRHSGLAVVDDLNLQNPQAEPKSSVFLFFTMSRSETVDSSIPNGTSGGRSLRQLLTQTDPESFAGRILHQVAKFADPEGRLPGETDQSAASSSGSIPAPAN